MKRFAVVLALLFLFGCAHHGLEQTGAWSPTTPAAGIQARYIDDAIRTNNAAIDAVFGDLLDAAVAVTSTAAELNILDGVTSTAAELNILDGVTSTAAELNILDGVTSTAAELNILDGATLSVAELNILDGVTSTAAELNILDGATLSVAELNILDGVTASAAQINAVALNPPTYTSVSPGGDFTSGTVYLAKIGRLVVMSWSNMPYTLATSAVSAAGVIPAAYRPVATISSVYAVNYLQISKMSVSTAGTLTVAHFDEDTTTQTGNQSFSGTMSWVSAS